jgi:hypothetical protein
MVVHRPKGPWMSWPLIFLVGVAALVLSLIGMGVL